MQVKHIKSEPNQIIVLGNIYLFEIYFTHTVNLFKL